MRWIGIIFVLLVSMVPAFLMCLAALDHNPQGEFADPITGAYTADLYILFLFWWVPFGLIALLSSAAILYLTRSD
jgi:hypothetical protein